MAEAAAPMDTDAAMAQKTFELNNDIQEVEPDAIFKYDHEAQQRFLEEKPWESNPEHFQNVKVSALALLKMTMHARSGGKLEVMGLMMGKVEGDCMIVMDSFALPVEGTETRVSAQQQAYGYMFAYIETMKKVDRLENVIGWYHSHPGYGCWLSGIDVNTQLLNQKGQDPFLAVVIDPVRTISAGKVELGAFRCYPENYKPPNAAVSAYQTIPLEKIEDFGVHASAYYPLKVTYFKSSLDRTMLSLLWNRYWVNTLSSSPLVTNSGYMIGQIADLGQKLEKAETQVSHASRSTSFADKPQEETQLSKCARDGSKVSIESAQCLMSQILKAQLFNQTSSE